MIIDKAWVLFGSTNWDTRSLRLNFELNVETYDRAVAKELKDLAEARRKSAIEVTLEQVNTRPFLIKLRDGTARLFAPYL
jgi:cardiolipin synthase